MKRAATLYAPGLTVEVFDKEGEVDPPDTGSVFDTLAPGFARQCGTWANPDPAWTDKTKTAMLADSGACMDLARRQVLVKGGIGHGTSQGTDIAAFNTATGKWSRVYESMPWDQMVSSNLMLDPNDPTRYFGKWISSGHPPVSHTHGSLVVRGSRMYELQRYCQIDHVPAPVPPNVTIKFFTGRICWYDFDAGEWGFSQHRTDWPIGGAAVLDPVSSLIYVFNRDPSFYTNVWKYDPDADTLVRAPNSARYGDNTQPIDAAYCPDDDKFYAFQNQGVVSRITIDRADFAKTTGVKLTTTGTKPVHSRPFYPSFTWDSKRKRFGGCIANATHYEFDPATLEWTATPFAVEAGSEGGSLPSCDFSHSVYDDSTGCYIFLQFAPSGGARTWAYRPVPLTAPGPDPGGADFDTRKTAPGVVRYFDFDSQAQLGGGYGDNFGTYTDNQGVRPALDAAVKCSGTSSLRLDVAPMSGADAGGLWFANFSADLGTRFGENEEFFVQWRQRFDQAMIDTLFVNDDGHGLAPKQIIVGPGDTANPKVWWNSCEAIHLVVQSYYQYRVPIVYNSCTGSASHPPYEGMYEPMTDGDHLLQNQLVCKRRSVASGGPDCVHWVADEWMTFQLGVTVGPRVGDEFMDSRTRLWIAREGQPSVLVLDWKPGIRGYWPLAGGPPAEDQQFGKIWLLAYMTGKVPQQQPHARTWYDELIISTQRIADPSA